MKIATRVGILMGLPILMGLVMGLIVMWSTQERARALIVNQQADQLQQSILTLVHLAGDYSRHPREERPIRQLRANYDNMALLISAPELVGAGDQSVTRLRVAHADLGTLLKKYEMIALSTPTPESALYNEQAVRTMEWIQVTIQSMVTEVQHIRTDVNANLMEVDRLAWLSVIVVVVFLALVSAVLALAMGRQITTPLQSLHEGTERIGEGDLDYRLEIVSNDEFSQLSHAFNDMTARLTETMASRDDLDEEVKQRKKAAAALRQAQVFLDDVIDSMPSILVCVDTNGVVTHWNREAQHITDVARGEAVGCIIDDVMPQLTKTLPDLEDTIATLQPHQFVKRELFLKGKRHFVNITVYPLTGGDERGATIRIDDITERVQVEEMAYQGEKLLSVTGLAAGMAHEMNNPLGGMVQGLQNVRRRLSPDLPKNVKVAEELGFDISALHDYMDRRDIFGIMDGIMEAGERVGGIVKKLLRFTRETGKAEKVPTDVAVLLDEALEFAMLDYDLKKIYGIRDIDIKRDFTPGVPAVKCAVTDIEQVFLNILRNAAQWLYLREDKTVPPCITLRTSVDDEGARIDIEDNGPGMDKEAERRAFEPFYTRHKPGQGAGLGLSVSFFIVHDENNGRMAIESELGQGTKVSVWLPFN